MDDKPTCPGRKLTIAMEEDMIREAEGGDSYESSIRSSPKPPRRLDSLSDSVVMLSYACELLARALDEGPLRTKVLELATKATEEAKKASYDPSKARRGTSRTVRASSVKDGADGV